MSVIRRLWYDLSFLCFTILLQPFRHWSVFPVGDVGHRDFCKAVLDVGSRNFKFPETVVLRDPIQHGWMYSSSTWGLVIPPHEGLSTTSLLTTTNHVVFTTRMPPSYTVLPIILSARECAHEAGSWSGGSYRALLPFYESPSLS